VRLELSIKTVDVHKTNLMRKLGVHDRGELLKYALQNRLVRLPILS
jgi:DNA-binding NarL/FixJ family response regulator